MRHHLLLMIVWVWGGWLSNMPKLKAPKPKPPKGNGNKQLNVSQIKRDIGIC